MCDGIHEVLGPRSPMAAGLRKNVCGVFQRVRSAIGWALSIDRKCERALLAAIGFYGDPARNVAGRLDAGFTPQQLIQAFVDVSCWYSLRYAAARAADVESHHQARAIGGSTIAKQPEAEPAVPATQKGVPLTIHLASGLPDQRAVREEPKIGASRMRCQQRRTPFVMVFVGERGKSRSRAGIVNNTMNESNQIRGQRHFMSTRHAGRFPIWGLSMPFIAVVVCDIKQTSRSRLVGRRRLL